MYRPGVHLRKGALRPRYYYKKSKESEEEKYAGGCMGDTSPHYLMKR